MAIVGVIAASALGGGTPPPPPAPPATPSAARPPDPAALAAALTDPCALFTTADVTFLIGGEGRFRDASGDIQGPLATCAYLGFPNTGTDVVEIGVAGPATFDTVPEGDAAAYLASVTSSAEAVPSPVAVGSATGLLVARGVGEVWVQAGDALVFTAVTRSGPRGDPEAAARLAAALLAKLAGT